MVRIASLLAAIAALLAVPAVADDMWWAADATGGIVATGQLGQPGAASAPQGRIGVRYGGVASVRHAGTMPSAW